MWTCRDVWSNDNTVAENNVVYYFCNITLNINNDIT